MEKLNKSLLAAEESIQTIPVGILYEGPNRRIRTINKAILKLFRIVDNPKDLIGINSDLIMPKIKENFISKLKFERFIKRCVLNKTEDSIDLETTYKLIVRIHYTSLFLKGEFISHNWFFYCINGPIESSMENNNKRKHPEIKNNSFKTSITHDIRNHISCINSSVELLELIDFRNPHISSQKFKKHFEDIKDQTSRILQIINNV